MTKQVTNHTATTENNFAITTANRAELQNLLGKNYQKDGHLITLEKFFAGREVDLEKVLTYGLPYLPNIINEAGQKDLDLLDGFTPEVVSYYSILSELSFLPSVITDVCLELSAYANGISIEIIPETYSLMTEQVIKEAITWLN